MALPRPLPPEIIDELNSRGGAGTNAQLRALGMTDNDVARSVRHGTLIRVGRGQYALASRSWIPDDSMTSDNGWMERSKHLHQLSAVLSACPDSTAGLRSAALAWALPVWRTPDLPEVIRWPNQSRLRKARTVRTPLPPDHVVRGKALTATTMERTAVDVALDLRTPQALITVDAALRRGASRDLMHQILEQRGKTRGAGRARQTLTWADAHIESPFESWSRGELMQHGLPRPRCNVTLELCGERARLDAFWEEYGIAGEADGRIKYQGDLAHTDTLWREKLRQEWLESAVGLIVVRWTSQEMRWMPESVTARWWRAAERRRSNPWTPPANLQIWQSPPTS